MKSCGFAEVLLHQPSKLEETQRYAAIRGGDSVLILEARA